MKGTDKVKERERERYIESLNLFNDDENGTRQGKIWESQRRQ